MRKVLSRKRQGSRGELWERELRKAGYNERYVKMPQGKPLFVY